MSIFSRDKKNEGEVLVYAVMDSAQGFMMPIFFVSEGVAVRAFGDAINGGDKSMAAHPEAYSLHRLGFYDPKSGLLTARLPELVVAGASLVSR